MPCCVVKMCQCLGGKCFLHLLFSQEMEEECSEDLSFLTCACQWNCLSSDTVAHPRTLVSSAAVLCEHQICISMTHSHFAHSTPVFKWAIPVVLDTITNDR